MTGDPDVTRVSRVRVVIHVLGFVHLESNGRRWYLATPPPSTHVTHGLPPHTLHMSSTRWIPTPVEPGM